MATSSERDRIRSARMMAEANDPDIQALIQRRADINRLAWERPPRPITLKRVLGWLCAAVAVVVVVWLSTGCAHAQQPCKSPAHPCPAVSQRAFPDTLLAGVTFACYSYPSWTGVKANLAGRLYCPLLDPDVKGSAPDGPHPTGFDSRWTCQVEPDGDSVLCEPDPDTIPTHPGRSAVGL
jgi:hypothetical protein